MMAIDSVPLSERVVSSESGSDCTIFSDDVAWESMRRSVFTTIKGFYKTNGSRGV